MTLCKMGENRMGWFVKIMFYEIFWIWCQQHVLKCTETLSSKDGDGLLFWERLHGEIMQQSKNNLPKYKSAVTFGLSPSVVHNIIKRFLKCWKNLYTQVTRLKTNIGCDLGSLRQRCFKNRQDSVVKNHRTSSGWLLKNTVCELISEFTNFL